MWKTSLRLKRQMKENHSMLKNQTNVGVQASKKPKIADQDNQRKPTATDNQGFSDRPVISDNTKLKSVDAPKRQDITHVTDQPKCKGKLTISHDQRDSAGECHMMIQSETTDRQSTNKQEGLHKSQCQAMPTTSAIQSVATMKSCTGIRDETIGGHYPTKPGELHQSQCQAIPTASDGQSDTTMESCTVVQDEIISGQSPKNQEVVYLTNFPRKPTARSVNGQLDAARESHMVIEDEPIFAQSPSKQEKTECLGKPTVGDIQSVTLITVTEDHILMEDVGNFIDEQTPRKDEAETQHVCEEKPNTSDDHSVADFELAVAAANFFQGISLDTFDTDASNSKVQQEGNERENEKAKQDQSDSETVERDEEVSVAGDFGEMTCIENKIQEQSFQLVDTQSVNAVGTMQNGNVTETEKAQEESSAVEDIETVIEEPTTSKVESTPGPSGKKNTRKENMQHRSKGVVYYGKKKESGGTNSAVTKKPREMGPPCDGKHKGSTKKPQCHLLTEDVRTGIFQSFWNELTWAQRKVYINSLVDEVIPNRARKESSRKKVTRVYHLRVQNERVQVCQEMFLSTLNIGEWCVYSWLTSANTHGINKEVKTIPSRARTFESGGSAKVFLDAVPKVESHYCRRNTNRLYLEPMFRSFEDVYREYQSYCGENNLVPGSKTTLRKEMDERKISIFKPRKDQCDKCCQYEEGNLSEEVYRKHIESKKAAQDEKARDKEKFKDKDDTVVITVDVQGVLLAPVLQASSLYYKMKLACHNYTVYDLKTHEVMCYIWHEGEGDVDSNAFASCLLHYLENNDRCKKAKTIVIYSDGCTYQNRNSVLANGILHYSILHGKTVIQKILERGHTYMEVDSVHAVCERAMRDRKIYVPANYPELIRHARKENPYSVTYLTSAFFKDYGKLNYYDSIRPGKSKGDSVVTDIRQLKYSGGEIMYKLVHTAQDNDFQYLPRRVRKNTGNITQKYLTHKPQIKKTKFDHLQELKCVIPEQYHEFYDKLQHNA